MMEHRGNARMCVGALGVILATSGCDGGVTIAAACNNPDLLGLWSIVPAAIGLVGGFVIYARRKSQLERWDLRDSPRGPSIQLTGAIVCAAIVLFSFPSFMLLAEACDPDQKLYNIGVWVTGSVLGMALALCGLWLANRPYSKESE